MEALQIEMSPCPTTRLKAKSMSMLWRLTFRECPQGLNFVICFLHFWLTPLAFGELPWKATDKKKNNNIAKWTRNNLKHNTLWPTVGKMYDTDNDHNHSHSPFLMSQLGKICVYKEWELSDCLDRVGRVSIVPGQVLVISCYPWTLHWLFPRVISPKRVAHNLKNSIVYTCWCSYVSYGHTFSCPILGSSVRMSTFTCAPQIN